MRQWLSKLLGNRGERLAAGYLRKQGYQILFRNYRSRWGEIDLVARDGDCLVFVEVKTRRTDRAGVPAEAVTPAKQAQLTRLALAFLKRYRRLEQAARFDVVAITWNDEGSPPLVEHLRDAFPAVGRGQMFS